MKLHTFVVIACLGAALGATAACSGDDNLHSGPVCPSGQEQVCSGTGERVRCVCVGPDSGSDAGDGG